MFFGDVSATSRGMFTANNGHWEFLRSVKSLERSLAAVETMHGRYRDASSSSISFEAMKFPFFSLFFVIFLGCSQTMSSPVLLGPRGLTTENSTNTTCNDPSSSVIYYEGFSPGRTAHMLQQHSSFVNSDSQGEDLQIQAAAFRAWNTPQTGTLSFWRLAAAGSPTPDYVFAMSSTNNPPVVSGFTLFPTIIAYVYPTQICDSVPLYVLYFPSTTDHYYTVDPTERQNLINFGWTDQGIAAFVLPV